MINVRLYSKPFGLKYIHFKIIYVKVYEYSMRA